MIKNEWLVKINFEYPCINRDFPYTVTIDRMETIDRILLEVGAEELDKGYGSTPFVSARFDAKNDAQEFEKKAIHSIITHGGRVR